MQFSAGEVNTSMSGVVKFSPKVPMLINNEIIVRLIDSFSNPVLLQQSKLKLEIGSINGSKFSTSLFIDNKDGSYSGTYLANDVGTYEICASFDGKHFSPCPFGVNVYRSKYNFFWYEVQFSWTFDCLVYVLENRIQCLAYLHHIIMFLFDRPTVMSTKDVQFLSSDVCRIERCTRCRYTILDCYGSKFNSYKLIL